MGEREEGLRLRLPVLPHLRNRCLPNLYYDHPGYFKVAVGLMLSHALAGVDTLLPGGSRHPHDTWQFIVSAAGGRLWLWGIVHFLIVALAFAGLYWPGRFVIAKLAWLISLVEFNALAIGFGAAFVANGGPLYPVVITLAASLSSLATLTEDPVNPTMRLHRDLRAGELPPPNRKRRWDDG